MSARPALAVGWNDLVAWAADPSGSMRFSVLDDTSGLLVDSDGVPPDASAEARVQRWLRTLACPVIAVGVQASALAAACDVQVATRDDAAPLLRNIEAAPRASALLVQVLRAVEHASVEDGLLIESLAYATLQAGPEFRRWREGSTPTPSRAGSNQPPAVAMRREGDRLLLQLDRPDRLNPMSVEMRDALIESLQLVLSDAGIAQVEIRGRGRCFSTGGDLDEFGSAPDPASAHLVRSLALPGRLLEACRERAHVFVHGACVGSGIEFPAFASRVVATADAWFQLPELHYGLIPGAGGCVSISRRIGRQRTAWLALSGKRIGARTALDWGLVDGLVDAIESAG